MSTRNIVPRAPGEGKLGTSAKNWNEIHAGEHFGAGCVPLGAIIAWLPYTFTGTQNSTPLLDDIGGGDKPSWLATYGFAVCDGNLATDHIADSTLTGYVPQLDDNRFLQGGTDGGNGDDIGVNGGQSEMPEHSHQAHVDNGASITHEHYPSYSNVGTGSTTTAGTGTIADENRPKYLSVYYIMRIK